jgi:hypothetical protein
MFGGFFCFFCPQFLLLLQRRFFSSLVGCLRSIGSCSSSPITAALSQTTSEGKVAIVAQRESSLLKTNGFHRLQEGAPFEATSAISFCTAWRSSGVRAKA